LLLGVACFGMGWVSSSRAAGAAAPPDSARPLDSRARPALPRGLLCARRGPSATQTRTEDCAEQRLRNTWCESQLASCEKRREQIRQDWPADPGVEDPTEWTDAVETALVECDIEGAELEVVDCTEYPCVAALRPSVSGGPDDEEFRSHQQELIEQLRACEPLRESFGLEGEAADKALDVFGNDTTCPNGERIDFLALMALDPSGPAYALIEDDDGRSKRQERDLFRWLFRRGDDIASVYPCDAAEGPGLDAR
jgi:hypothetical protein